MLDFLRSLGADRTQAEFLAESARLAHGEAAVDVLRVRLDGTGNRASRRTIKLAIDLLRK